MTPTMVRISPEASTGSSIAVSATPLLPSLARNFSAQIVARLASTLVQAGALVLVARTLGPSRYGLFAVIVTLTVMVSVIAEWGLPLIAARTIAVGRRGRDEVLAAVLGLRLSLAVVACAVVVGLAFLASDSGEVRLGALIASLSFLPQAWLGSAQIQAQLELRLERVAWATLGAALSGAAWMLAVVGLGGGIPVLAIGLLVSATASAIVGVALTPGGIPLRPRAPQELWRELLRDATPLAVSFLLVAVYLYVGLGLLARISTPEQVGLYDAAFRFMFLGVLLPSAVMSSIYAYAAAQAAEDRARFAQIARELLSLIVLLVPLPLIVMSADPAGVMTLLYGEAYAAGADILRVLGAAVALAIVSGIVGPLIVALGHERATLRIGACAAVASISLNLLLIPALDGVGAAIVTVTTELLVVVPALVLLIRRGSVRIDGTQMAKVALAGGVAFAAALGVATIAGVVVAVAAGVALYVGLLVAMGAVDRRRLALMRSPAGR